MFTDIAALKSMTLTAICCHSRERKTRGPGVTPPENLQTLTFSIFYKGYFCSFAEKGGVWTPRTSLLARLTLFMTDV